MLRVRWSLLFSEFKCLLRVFDFFEEKLQVSMSEYVLLEELFVELFEN